MRTCLTYTGAVSHVCLVYAIILILFLVQPRLCPLDHCTSNDASTTWTQSAVERHGNARLYRWCEIGLSRFTIYSLLWWILDKISMLGRTTNFHALPVWRHGYIDFLEVLISSVCPTPRKNVRRCLVASLFWKLPHLSTMFNQVYQSRRLPLSIVFHQLPRIPMHITRFLVVCSVLVHKIGSAPVCMITCQRIGEVTTNDTSWNPCDAVNFLCFCSCW